VGITAEATTHQYPRPGVEYRVLRHAPRIRVLLAWWRDDPPDQLREVVTLAREAYGWSAPEGGQGGVGEEAGDGLG
jgi:hypothetical protein